MAEVEQTDQELAFEVGNDILNKLIQEIANPSDPNAWKVINWRIKYMFIVKIFKYFSYGF